MKQLSLFERAAQAPAPATGGAAEAFQGSTAGATPDAARPKCHNLNCSNPALPGRDMCRTCAERFQPLTRARLLGWRG